MIIKKKKKKRGCSSINLDRALPYHSFLVCVSIYVYIINNFGGTCYLLLDPIACSKKKKKKTLLAIPFIW